MDGSRFDRVTRALAGATSRRAVVRGALGAVLGGAALHEAADAAVRRRPVCLAAGVNCTRSGQCCSGMCQRMPRGGGRSPRYSCACDAGLTLCGRDCRDLQTDVAHCGACGHACGVNADCIDGACVSTAPTSCYQYEPNVATDELVCGITWDDREVKGCDFGYFADVANGDSYPCQTDADCQDGSTIFTGPLDCSLDINLCYCDLGRWDNTTFVPSSPSQCVWLYKAYTCEGDD